MVRYSKTKIAGVKVYVAQPDDLPGGQALVPDGDNLEFLDEDFGITMALKRIPIGEANITAKTPREHDLVVAPYAKGGYLSGVPDKPEIFRRINPLAGLGVNMLHFY